MRFAITRAVSGLSGEAIQVVACTLDCTPSPRCHRRTSAVSNDPLLGFLWGMGKAGAVDAWAAGNIGASSVVVGVVDTGVDELHPDLAANMWVNSGEIPANGIDDDHNGVYRVDLETGEVQDLGTAGHVDGEGEGIDATDLGGALLHVLVADEAIVPMWVVDLEVASGPA